VATLAGGEATPRRDREEITSIELIQLLQIDAEDLKE
jgi:hypothetical protein